MGALEAIIVLAVVGFLLMAAEVFVPGLILGILGGLFLLCATVVAYAGFGSVMGTVVFVGIAALSLAGFVVWMYAFPHTIIGRRIMLQKSLVQGGSHQSPPAGLLGREGKSLTPLRPAGSIVVEGKKYDVLAESDFIAAEEDVVIVRQEGFRIVVRKKSAA